MGTKNDKTRFKNSFNIHLLKSAGVSQRKLRYGPRQPRLPNLVGKTDT